MLPYFTPRPMLRIVQRHFNYFYVSRLRRYLLHTYEHSL